MGTAQRGGEDAIHKHNCTLGLEKDGCQVRALIFDRRHLAVFAAASHVMLQAGTSEAVDGIGKDDGNWRLFACLFIRCRSVLRQGGEALPDDAISFDGVKPRSLITQSQTTLFFTSASVLLFSMIAHHFFVLDSLLLLRLLYW